MPEKEKDSKAVRAKEKKKGEAKGEKKGAKGEEKEKAEKEKKKPIKRVVKKKEPKKSESVRVALKAIAKKKKLKFRGRFGKSSVRRTSKAKWKKWRVPRGEDIRKTRQYAKTPRSGYRTARAIRARHPSGYFERLIRNESELELLAKEKESVAARISARVGGKKRNKIIKKANELGMKIMN